MGGVLRRVAFCSLILVLDQLTKHIAVTQLELGRPVPIIEGLFNLTLVHNPGAAFGMFSTLSDGLRRAMLGGVSCIALIVVMRFMLHEAKHDSVSQYALTAILAGAVGNLIDRYRFDAVVDFLDFYWRHHHWPAFNVADSAISLGVVVLIIRMVWHHAPENLHSPVESSTS